MENKPPSEEKLNDQVHMEPSDFDKVDQAVVWLRSRKSRIQSVLTLQAKVIGQYLIDHFFDGDAKNVSDQNPNKNVSFRKLLERSDLPFPPTSLRRFIQVAINFKVLPFEKARELPPSHHSILYQVYDPEERKKIGVLAADEQVSVRKLRSMVQGKGRRRTGGGRKSQSDFVKQWKKLSCAVDQLDQCCCGDDFLEERMREEVRKESREVRDRLTKILDRLNDLSSD